MANQSKKKTTKKQRPKQEQARQPGRQTQMTPEPTVLRDGYRGSGKLDGRAVLITGGDSGIGRAVAAAMAREGADIACVYLEEDTDARATQQLVETAGRRCILLRGDIRDEAFCRQSVADAVESLGRLDVLINNAAVQFPQSSLLDISTEQLETTFRTNILAVFHMIKAALPHLEKQAGSSIINTTSVTAYRGSAELIDYSATKGAIVALTRSLSQNLAKKKIRVNAVAPGPIWTPLIPATFPGAKVESFGSNTPLGRAGQPWECAGCYVFLASDDANYITGQVLHPNGGEIVNS